MRSVTSFFNPTLYRKNLTRFWPLWAIWTVMWAFVMPLNLLNQLRYYPVTQQENVYRFYRDCLSINGNVGEAIILLGAAYSVLIVMAVFGYLFNHRSAAAIHAMPMRRENLFITNYLSGLAFIVVPNMLVYAATALVELTVLPAELSAVALGCLWDGFWVGLGALFFLYTFAVFCAQFTGNVLALPAFYVILNVLVFVMYNLCTEMADQIFYGGWPFQENPRWVELLTPLNSLMYAARWNYVPFDAVWNRELGVPVFGRLEALEFRDAGLVAGYAAAAVVLAAVSLLIYRRRHIETAGDVVSVKAVRPVFRIGVSVCAGLCGGIVMAAFFGWHDDMLPTVLCVFFWAVVGYFVAEMLLNKSFRVLKKAWRGCVVTAAVLTALVLGCYVDVFGLETWVPDPRMVEGISLSMNDTYPYDDGSHYNKGIVDPAEIERIVDLHEAILRDYEEHGDRFYGDELMYVRIGYIMDNGAEYYKRYNIVNLVQDEINIPGTTTFKVDQFVNDPQVLEWAYSMEQARKSKVVLTELENLTYSKGRFGSEVSTQGAEEIWAAVQADFAAGNLGKRYLFDDEVRRAETYKTDLRLRFLSPEREDEVNAELYYEKYVAPENYAPAPTVEVEDRAYVWNWTMTITLTPKAERTLAALEKYYDLGGAYDIALHE